MDEILGPKVVGSAIGTVEKGNWYAHIALPVCDKTSADVMAPMMAPLL